MNDFGMKYEHRNGIEGSVKRETGNDVCVCGVCVWEGGNGGGCHVCRWVHKLWFYKKKLWFIMKIPYEM